MQRPISLKIYSIALGLLVLMVVVTGLSARNLKILNNEVAALSGYYVPLDQQIGSVETLVRQQVVHFERILLLMQARDRDRAALEEEQRLFDQRGVNADQVIDSSLRLVEQALRLIEVPGEREGREEEEGREAHGARSTCRFGAGQGCARCRHGRRCRAGRAQAPTRQRLAPPTRRDVRFRGPRPRRGRAPRRPGSGYASR